ncbi:TolC family protein [Riemerella columbina]|uniref:TolC family protein n=1 Tax=Riemerella columbina TaxID=103810 RepID=UPI0003628AB9|nr:TolC family protein [Riemerella columbina]
MKILKNMNKYYRNAILSKWWLALVAWHTFTLGQSQIVVTEGVQNAIAKAMHKDVQLRNQDLEQHKLELERQNVLNKRLPKLEANAIYGYLNNQTNIDIPTKTLPITGIQLFDGSTDIATEGQAFNGRLTAKAVLYSGGQIENGAKALQEKNKGTAYMMALRKNEVIEDLLTSFDQLEMLRTAEALIQDSDKRLKKENDRVEKAIALGLAIPYDRDKIKLARLELETKRTDVQNKKELLALKINQLTDLSPEDILAIEHKVEPIVILQNLDTENRNEIKALEAFKQASEYAIKKEKGALLPTLGAFGGYSYTSIFNTNTEIPLHKINHTIQLNTNHITAHPTFMVGVAMKWKLFNGFESKNNIETAKLNAMQIENKLQDTKEKLNLQLRKNQLEYETMLRQIDIAEQREKIAENNNVMAEKQYRNGLIGITERITAENDIYKEALNKVETVIKERKAAIETYKSAGTLDQYIITTL